MNYNLMIYIEPEHKLEFPLTVQKKLDECLQDKKKQSNDSQHYNKN